MFFNSLRWGSQVTILSCELRSMNKELSLWCSIDRRRALSQSLIDRLVSAIAMCERDNKINVVALTRSRKAGLFSGEYPVSLHHIFRYISSLLRNWFKIIANLMHELFANHKIENSWCRPQRAATHRDCQRKQDSVSKRSFSCCNYNVKTYYYLRCRLCSRP